jgi:hypothetical protein
VRITIAARFGEHLTHRSHHPRDRIATMHECLAHVVSAARVRGGIDERADDVGLLASNLVDRPRSHGWATQRLHARRFVAIATRTELLGQCVALAHELLWIERV